MCISPIKIRVNKNILPTSFAHLYHLVPCGRCFECVQHSVDEWNIRCYFEYLRSKTTYFTTLTMNEQHISILDDLLCTNKRDLQLFFKRFRKYLTKLYGHGARMKYFVTSELGEKFHRPHYHLLMFFNVKIDAYTLRYLVTMSWKLGFNCPGKINQGIVCSSAGIGYVCKYIHKSDYNYNIYSKGILFRIARYYFNDFVKRGFKFPSRFRRHSPSFFVDEKSTDDCVYNNYLKAIRHSFNKYNIFKMSSTHLGENGLEYVNEQTQTISHIGLNNNYSYALPRFYRRLLYFDKVHSLNNAVENPSPTKYVLNSHGIETAMSLYPKKLKESINRYDDLLHTFRSMPSSLKSVFFCDIPFTSEELAKYSLSYRYKFCLNTEYQDVYLSTFLSDKWSRKFYTRSFGSQAYEDIEYINHLTVPLTFDQIAQFSALEQSCLALERYNSYIKLHKSTQQQRLIEHTRYLRDSFYNTLNV